MDVAPQRRPPRRLPRWTAWPLAVAMLLLLGGCNALRLGYNQGPTLTYWWIDRYADFDAEQAPRVKAAIGEWFRWHRRTQLPGYAELLQRAVADVPHSVRPEQVCRYGEEGRRSVFAAVERAVPAMADAALALKPAQIRHVEERYAKTNEDFADDYLQSTPEKRRAEVVKRTIERAEMFYGRLDDAQRELVVRSVAASPMDADLWMAERRARQQEVLATLRRLVETHPSREAAQQAVRGLIARYDRSPNAGWQLYQERLIAYNCAFIADLHNATSVAQRKKAAERLEGWRADLQTLVAEQADEP